MQNANSSPDGATVLTVTPNSAVDIWTTVSRIRSGTKLRCAVPQYDPGGGGINVSRVLHRLGAKTLALFTGGGTVGDELAGLLEGEGVPAERQHVSGETRQSLHVLEEETSELFRFVMPGPQISKSEADAFLDRLQSLARPETMIVGSGSLPPGIGEDFWAEAARLARQAGCPFLLDSAHGVQAALEHGLYVLRQNLDELSDVVGRALSWPDEAAEWSRQQIADGACACVVVTSGAEGALLVTSEDRVRLKPPDVEIRSAVGAGDSFMGGLCLGLARGEAPRNALRLAVATAAATMITPATELCRKEDVYRVLEQTGATETV